MLSTLPPKCPLTPNYSDGAQEAIEEYFGKIGGRPEKPTKKRKSMGAGAASTPDKPPAKRGRKAQASTNGTPETEKTIPDWVPKSKSWDAEIKSIDTIIRDPGTENLYVFLDWNNGRKSKVSLETCYERCPMKVRIKSCNRGERRLTKP